jgi:hypothetical protein
MGSSLDEIAKGWADIIGGKFFYVVSGAKFFYIVDVGS